MNKQDYLEKYKSDNVPKPSSLMKKKKKNKVPRVGNSRMIDGDIQAEEDHKSIWFTGKKSSYSDDDEYGAQVVDADLRAENYQGNFKSLEQVGVANVSFQRRSPSPDIQDTKDRRSPTPDIHDRSPRGRSQGERDSFRASPSPSPDRLNSPNTHKPRASPSMSPSPRRVRKRDGSISRFHERERIEKDVSLPRMSDGTLSGLQTGKDIKKQLERQKKEMERQFANAAATETQETVYRDKSGKKIDLTVKKAEEMAAKRKKDAEIEAKMKWGQGIAQAKEADDLKRRLKQEERAGLATYADDSERNDILKEKVRWGDSMAPIIGKKKKSRRVRYQGVMPPNRYGIEPGYRWDGVDRSNGFELKLFRSKHAFQETRKEYDRWAMEDM